LKEPIDIIKKSILKEFSIKLKMACPICFDEMDMREFQDPEQSTATCFKLECGHAFHTKCIIETLSKSNHECPSCNKYKTPDKELEIDGVIVKLIGEIKKDQRVRIAKNEFVVAINEYKGVLSKIKKEARDWVKNRAKELKLDEHKKYYVDSIQSVLNSTKIVAKEMGPKYIGALKSQKTGNNNDRFLYGQTLVNQCLFGNYRYRGYYRDWRFRNPRVTIAL